VCWIACIDNEQCDLTVAINNPLLNCIELVVVNVHNACLDKVMRMESVLREEESVHEREGDITCPSELMSGTLRGLVTFLVT